ncbi:MAG: YkgJ family cysteine cluster protein [Candidatus Lokiarchaeota archaeon]|nr:YkgJ family cysteine cluster protein [Candidatus Lokiarchaeota archaeon]
MTENSKNEEGTEKKDEIEEEEQVKEDTDVKTDIEEPKAKFTFKCTRSDKCCLTRGPIPITLWDLELWARNGVVANFLPYLDIYSKPDGGIDLVLKPLPPAPKEGEEEKPRDPFGTVPIEDLLEVKCPLYNKEKKECLVYDNRPLSCRTYPLEFDGKNFTVVDVECPGIGEEGMTKDDLKEMRDIAKQMFYELTRMRISLPVLSQLISQKVMMDLMRQNMEAMSKMSEEDRSKLDEILKKEQEPQPE